MPICVSKETSVPQETAGASPCTPCRMKSTLSRRDAVVRAGCRSRWIDSLPFCGRVAAGTVPHRCGFVPALSTRTPDRLNRLTLPPRQIAKSGRISKKLVNYQTFSQNSAGVATNTERHAKRKTTIKTQGPSRRSKMLQVSKVSKPTTVTQKTDIQSPVTIKSLRIS